MAVQSGSQIPIVVLLGPLPVIGSFRVTHSNRCYFYSGIGFTRTCPLPHTVCRPTPVHSAAFKYGKSSRSAPVYSTAPVNPPIECVCFVLVLKRRARVRDISQFVI